MAKRVVVSHFFNEAYLLPWWLRHHREIFDHGVLIDYHSTDDSVAICRELVPHWEVVSSENATFAALLCDFEVMKHEQRFPDAWKLALNTTEFFVAPGLAKMERVVAQHDLTGVCLPGAVMVDTDPHNPPDPLRPLVEQKATGIWEDEIDFAALAIPGLTFPTRSRLYHRYAIGAYTPGRHNSHLPRQCNGSRELGSIRWYGFSPWSNAFKARKLQISDRRDSFDVKNGFGAQHQADIAELDGRWSKLRPLSGILRNAA
ncbi:glycosyltransferase family 2 protein [Hyphomicrobium facile]|uniref:Glycosyl transferase family 2 n=1 Tax=Hyphomicrobium facile TaxID=51670 RepID=A0A1I7NJ36_9HYPH|nr:glycosyltransferase family 2 protein [Hyphomicrobium facile]SFV34663.1 Glycosyl transferase family 2 [Hyphomicrobium facile]